MTDSTEPDFTCIFAREIAPHLDRLEEARRHELPRLRRRATAFTALSLAWLAVLPMTGIPLLWLTVLPLAAIGLFIALQLRAAPGRDYAQALRAIVLPPLCAFAGGWRHERLDNRDIFRKGEVRAEPDWPLFDLPDWRTPIPPIVRTDISRLLALLASAQPSAYAEPPRDQQKEPQVTS